LSFHILIRPSPPWWYERGDRRHAAGYPRYSDGVAMSSEACIDVSHRIAQTLSFPVASSLPLISPMVWRRMARFLGFLAAVREGAELGASDGGATMAFLSTSSPNRSVAAAAGPRRPAACFSSGDGGNLQQWPHDAPPQASHGASPTTNASILVRSPVHALSPSPLHETLAAEQGASGSICR
jgi:hypothetical protein